MASLGTQVGLLLWKNLTIRKRKPVHVVMEPKNVYLLLQMLLVVELVLPLVLLTVLYYIRFHQPPERQLQSNYTARALPSAGLVPMLESLFCTTGGEPDGFGFNRYPNSSTTAILEFMELMSQRRPPSPPPPPAPPPADRPPRTDDTESSGGDVCDDSLGPKQNRTTGASAVLLWVAVQQVICGQNPDLPPEMNTTAQFVEYLGLNDYYKGRLAILFYMLSKNPRVFFSPDTPLAHRIISEVNKTVDYFASVSDLARHFLSTSQPVPDNFPIPAWQVTLAACAWLQMTAYADLDMFRPFATEQDAIDYFLNGAAADNVSVLAVLAFDLPADGRLPNHLTYTIRQNSTLTANTVLVRQRAWMPGPRDWDYNYYEFGFTWLQDLVERAVASLHAGRDILEPGGAVQEMPYPCFMRDTFLFYLETVMPLCLTLGWVCGVALQVQQLVQEREDRLREVMLTLGVSGLAVRTSWVLTSLLLATPSALAVMLVLCYGGILRYSSASLVFCLLQLFVIDNIALAHLLSALSMGRARTAAACSVILYFMFYVPYVYVSVVENTAMLPVSSGIKALACLMSPSAFNLAFKYVGFYEQQGTGVSWSSWTISPVENDSFSMALTMLLMLLDPVLYGLLVWYIENVFPGAVGIPLPWYFPFSPDYWCSGMKRHDSSLNAESTLSDEGLLSEPDPADLPLAVELRALTKRFPGQRRPAVDRLNLRLFEGQVTALLGHNGAGKTTTLSILSGLLPACSGSVSVYGASPRGQLAALRRFLGFCPQQDVLVDGLTAAEHVWFYGRMRGAGADEAVQQTISVLADIDLLKSRDRDVRVLSGGQRRKLSVAIAFLGGSRCIVLDEPTAGVDPHSRRAIWRLIVKYKPGRTILFCTHYMEEADVLANRIAILSAGKVKCVGSPTFLRRHLGAGYHLHVVRAWPHSAGAPPEMAASSDAGGDTWHGQSSAVTSLIREHVSSARLVRGSAHELHYLLCGQQLRSGVLTRLMTQLERRMAQLGVASYGVQTTSMEEVFMRITRNGDASAAAMSITNGTPNVGDSHVVFAWRGDLHSRVADLPADDVAVVAASAPGPVDDSGLSDETGRAAGSPQLGARCDLTAAPPHGGSVNCDDTATPPHGGSVKSDVTGAPPHGGSVKSDVTGDRCTGRCLLWQQFMAVLRKRFYCSRHDWTLLVSWMVLPAFFTFLAMSVAVVAPKVTDKPALVMAPTQYFNYTWPIANVVPVANNQLDTLNPGFSTDANSAALAATLRLASGLGATCVLLDPHNASRGFDPLCDTVRHRVHRGVIMKKRGPRRRSVGQQGPLTTLPPDPHRMYPSCRCRPDGAGQECSLTGYRLPRDVAVATKDVLQNITAQPEADFYLYTTDLFRLRRYGGLSFGLVHDVTPAGFGSSLTPQARRTSVRRLAKAWFNNKGLHAVPAYVNALNNAVLRANLPAEAGDPAAYGITCVNHPLPRTETFTLEEEIRQGTDVLIALFLLVALSFVPASLVLLLVSEQRLRSKHLQRLCGLDRTVYWLANYCYDLVSTCIPSAACILIMLAFGDPAYTSASNLPAVSLLVLLYGWSMTPLMYPASFVFREPGSAYIAVVIFNLFLGAAGLLTTSMFESFADSTVVAALKTVFLVLPNYCLGRGLVEIAYNQYHNDFLTKTGSVANIVYPLSGVALRYLVAMVVMAAFGLATTLLLEHRPYRRWKRSGPAPPAAADPLQQEDRDVAAERRRVTSGAADGDCLKLHRLTKVYRAHGTAVDGLCFGVSPGECFGLLGVNGAGKTSTFRMLTGDTSVTSGDAIVKMKHSSGLTDVSLRHELDTALGVMGYCPQQDALHAEMTVSEHLTVYAMIRGVPPCRLQAEVDRLIGELKLGAHRHQLASVLSGGTRRKLSTALALVGSPQLVLLDEPTTGMDPAARRFLWELVRRLVSSGRAVLLTSHSMDECEALCTRLAVMVNGRLRCLGSPQHLKDRFGDGYTITIRSGEADPSVVDRRVKVCLPLSRLKECHLNVWTYELAAGAAPLSEVFGRLDQLNTELQIDDCYVSQNTLDSVFVSLARQQSESASPEEEVPPPACRWEEATGGGDAAGGGGNASSPDRPPVRL